MCNQCLSVSLRLSIFVFVFDIIISTLTSYIKLKNGQKMFEGQPKTTRSILTRYLTHRTHLATLMLFYDSKFKVHNLCHKIGVEPAKPVH